jgi:hypothetical protein
MGAGRELKNLPNHLHDGERVELVATGTYANGTGLLVLTDRRLLFVKDGITSKTTEDFLFSRITSVQLKTGMVMSRRVITVSGNAAEITNVQKDDGQAMADAIRAIINAPVAVAEPAAPAAAPQPDVYEQLKKLAELRDAGILSEAEFDTKKAELVSRI